MRGTRSRTHSVIPDPKPREGNRFVSILIPVYCVSLMAFLVPLMRPARPLLAYAITSATALLLLWAHIAVMQRRDRIHTIISLWAAKLSGQAHPTPVRFFEFPFAFIILLLYATAFLAVPLLAGLVPLVYGAGHAVTPRDVPLYFVAALFAVLAATVLSGFDIYPVNHFGTPESLKILISITMQLMTAVNRLIVLITVSILLAWAIGRIELGRDLIFFTMYVLVGLGAGATGVLGSRLTDLLYELSEIEVRQGARARKRLAADDEDETSDATEESAAEEALEPAASLLEPGPARA
jgi:hypothetical protein